MASTIESHYEKRTKPSLLNGTSHHFLKMQRNNAEYYGFLENQ